MKAIVLIACAAVTACAITPEEAARIQAEEAACKSTSLSASATTWCASSGRPAPLSLNMPLRTDRYRED
jgi:hypothetical protein